MCGIVGVAGDMQSTPRKAFTELLIFDVVRGKDSTGVAAIKKESWKVHKAIGTPHDLLERDSARNDIEMLNNICLIGHNRYATVGGVKRSNAHPFEFEHVVGVHNGTLRNKYDLEDHTNFGTDSEALYYNINKNGLKETMAKVDGAYTLVWFDKRDNTINFLRNQERPLAIALSEDKKFLFWASEKDMLEFTLNRNGIKYGIVELPVDMHYAFKIPTSMAGSFDKPSVKQVKGKEVSYSVTTYDSRNTNKDSFRQGQQTQQSGEKAPKKIKEGPFKLSKAPVGRMTELTFAYRGSNVFRETFLTARIAGDKTTEYRLYYTNVKDIEAIETHRHFRAMISRVEAIEFIGGHKIEYYVLTPHCVQIGHADTPVINKDALDIDEDDIPDTAFEETVIVKDHNGIEVSREHFTFRYNACGWCSEPINYGDKFLPLGHNSCVCDSCSANEEVKKAIGNNYQGSLH